MQHALNQFIQEACIEHPSATVPVALFHDAFAAWWTARHGGPVPTKHAVIAAAEAAGYKIGRRNGRLHLVGVEFRPAPLVVNEAGRIVHA